MRVPRKLVACALAVTGWTHCLTAAVAESGPLEAPVELLGQWQQQDHSCREARGAPAVAWHHDGADPTYAPANFSSMVLTSRHVELSDGSVARTCRVIGLRRQHQARWYLDLSCDGGSLELIDVNLLAPDHLILAVRPMGVAVSFRACGR
ncbi:MAG: hypothetical protein NW217_11865 [Hyphomicrobiaceae bacterium]|nr:hypothetical protein [Hyphomicrobiaceae bacterium]